MLGVVATKRERTKWIKLTLPKKDEYYGRRILNEGYESIFKARLVGSLILSCHVHGASCSLEKTRGGAACPFPPNTEWVEWSSANDD